MERNSSSSSTSEDSGNSTAFQRWLKKAAVLTGIGITPEERQRGYEDQQHVRCEKWKTELMSYSPSVVFMLKHLRLSGCTVPHGNIICAPCDLTRSGGFHPAGGIVLCQNHLSSKRQMEDTLTHELVHMHDHCKFNVDWHNLRHHACSEIRANSLSGDCRYMRELGRGHVSFTKQHQTCVRRRAILSVRANPSCPDEATAARAVNEVWESCFNDTRPFDEVRLSVVARTCSHGG
ncbi:peptidase M76 family-domain-containing protein [Boletus edulis]|uniref:Mitochondrial inner membrane protease ATP23 n=1 Tax=Boletus edulis BED1 TaxID=1328754 RepID=A0AAD4BPH9_BOLED|nr:peptidase M76 family-domain-containing protein [Boletus edulis]KAF8435831.1 peptidase M76 family-domain-containing protein [Boletus edulis BED1]